MNFLLKKNKPSQRTVCSKLLAAAIVIASARLAARITARVAAATVVIAAEKTVAVTAAAEYKNENNYNPNPLAAAVVAAVVSTEKSHKNTSFYAFVVYTMLKEVFWLHGCFVEDVYAFFRFCNVKEYLRLAYAFYYSSPAVFGGFYG